MSADYHALLFRHHQSGDGTFGVFDADGFACLALELPWQGNGRNVSCIPLGVYPVVWAWSPAFARETYRVTEVLGRDGILIHPANTADELRGCIAVGMHFGSFDVGNGRTMGGVSDSREALDALHAHFRHDDAQVPFILEIVASDPVGALSDAGAAIVERLETHRRQVGGVQCAELYGGVGPEV